MTTSTPRLLPVTLAAISPTEKVVAKPDLNWLRKQFAEELSLLHEQTIAAAKKEAEESAKKELQKSAVALQQTAEQQLKTLQAGVEEQAQSLHSVICAFKDAHAQLQKVAEQAAIDMTIASLCKLVGDHYVDKQWLAGAIKEVLAQNKTFDHIAIRVSPSDYDNLMSFDELSTIREWLQVDESLSVTSCLIDIGNKRLDASLLQQLDQLRESLVVNYEQRQHR